MHKRLLAVFMALVLSACAVTNTQTFTGSFEPPPAQSRVLSVTPDVQLSLLTAAGLNEAREDWSQSGRDNISAALQAYIEREGHSRTALDPATAMDGRVGQVIRLHEVVSASIQGRYALPTKKNVFDWTLGDGVRELGSTYNSDYALFITGRGNYASAGRAAAMIGLSIIGVGITMGSQYYTASLVDLRTGNVIWSNVMLAGQSHDARTPAGAALLVDDMMKDAPL